MHCISQPSVSTLDLHVSTNVTGRFAVSAISLEVSIAPGEISSAGPILFSHSLSFRVPSSAIFGYSQRLHDRLQSFVPSQTRQLLFDLSK